MKSAVLENEGACTYNDIHLTEDERRFLCLIKNSRPIFLDHLQDLGLLLSFLEAESETISKP